MSTSDEDNANAFNSQQDEQDDIDTSEIFTVAEDFITTVVNEGDPNDGDYRTRARMNSQSILQTSNRLKAPLHKQNMDHGRNASEPKSHLGKMAKLT